MKQKEEKKILSIKEVSEITKMSPSALYQVIHHDRLPCKSIGSRFVVEKEVLDKWMDTNLKKEAKKK
jgi:excisionase family DNA binding protein